MWKFLSWSKITRKPEKLGKWRRKQHMTKREDKGNKKNRREGKGKRTEVNEWRRQEQKQRGRGDRDRDESMFEWLQGYSKGEIAQMVWGHNWKLEGGREGTGCQDDRRRLFDWNNRRNRKWNDRRPLNWLIDASELDTSNTWLPRQKEEEMTWPFRFWPSQSAAMFI